MNARNLALACGLLLAAVLIVGLMHPLRDDHEAADARVAALARELGAQLEAKKEAEWAQNARATVDIAVARKRLQIEGIPCENGLFFPTRDGRRLVYAFCVPGADDGYRIDISMIEDYRNDTDGPLIDYYRKMPVTHCAGIIFVGTGARCNN